MRMLEQQNNPSGREHSDHLYVLHPSHGLIRGKKQSSYDYLEENERFHICYVFFVSSKITDIVKCHYNLK